MGEHFSPPVPEALVVSGEELWQLTLAAALILLIVKGALAGFGWWANRFSSEPRR